MAAPEGATSAGKKLLYDPLLYHIIPYYVLVIFKKIPENTPEIPEDTPEIPFSKFLLNAMGGFTLLID